MLLIILLVASCNNENSLIINNEKGWEPYGLDSLAVGCLVFEEPYLYACGGKKGLWRRNVRTQTAWEYLGFADTTSGDDYDVGVTEVDVRGNDILVLFSPGEKCEYFDPALVGIWRSKDNGKTFIRSDSGIVDDYGNPSHFVFSIGRSYINPMIGLATTETRFRTTNGGDSWYPIDDIRFFPGGEEQKWHPNKSLDVWILYKGGLWDFIQHSKDGGITNTSIGRFPPEPVGGLNDIDFDAADSNVVYIASIPLIKSTDSGLKWFFPMGSRSLPIFQIVSHPLIHDLLYFNSWDLYRSTDGGKSITFVGKPNDIEINSMIIDHYTNILFVATNKGIIKYNP
ncbi:MAG: hypothetical protein QME52_06265 [Bacteroidota bacterium]|nr:hypothetical protein [Bacteroidota bacterium]